MIDCTCESVIPILKADFSALWKCQQRGSSIEVITPFSTTTDKFISVFVARRDGELLISDAGWLRNENNLYEILDEPEEIEFEAALKHFSEKFGIQSFRGPDGRLFYFKRVLGEELFSAAVYDVSNFLACVVNWASLPRRASVEAEHRKTFHRKAHEFIKSALTPSVNANFSFKVGHRLEGLPEARFNLAVIYTNRLSLVSYVTGSTDTRFSTDFKKAIVNFELTKSSRFANLIKSRVAFINDEADGFNPAKNVELYNLLGSHSGRAVRWSQRDGLAEML
jgi:hypothetical protein